MNARIVSFIEGGCRREDAQTTGVYPESINQLGNGTIFLVDCGIEDRLCAVMPSRSLPSRASGN